MESLVNLGSSAWLLKETDISDIYEQSQIYQEFHYYIIMLRICYPSL